MDLSALARPYAIAAFETAVEGDAVANWSSQLALLNDILANDQVKQILSDPNVTSTQLSDVVITIAQGQLHDVVANFVKLLAQADKLICFSEIVALFELLKTETNQTISVTVKSAVPLTEAYKEKLKGVLKKRLNRNPVLDCVEDPTLLGGMVITAGDTVFDGSVMGQLQRFEERIMG